MCGGWVAARNFPTSWCRLCCLFQLSAFSSPMNLFSELTAISRPRAYTVSTINMGCILKQSMFRTTVSRKSTKEKKIEKKSSRRLAQVNKNTVSMVTEQRQSSPLCCLLCSESWQHKQMENQRAWIITQKAGTGTQLQSHNKPFVAEKAMRHIDWCSYM